ncbi:MAG: hypothetical protein DMF19_09665 [Verrucomicrobia bacterium]|nr:MAG: hypothetical protein DMF19_09665 [Verrucomicrobiota bacterium]
MADSFEPTSPPPAPEPIPPNPNPPPEPPPRGENVTSDSTGLPSNVAAALACFPLIGGIIFYLLEKRDNFVRFYAMQSIILGIGWFVFAVAWTVIHGVLAPIPGIGPLFGFVLWVLWAVVNVAIVIVWIIAMIKAFSGSRWDIPYVGPMARKYSGD